MRAHRGSGLNRPAPSDRYTKPMSSEAGHARARTALAIEIASHPPFRAQTSSPRHYAGLWLVACVVVSAWAGAVSISAQRSVEADEPKLEDLDLGRIDALLAKGEATEALGLLEGYLKTSPGDVEAGWRGARAATLVGLLSPTRKKARPHYRDGIAYADDALAVQPDHPDALMWSMAAKGRLALWTGAKETADLAQDVWELSHRLLAEYPDNAMAHHALGVTHYQVRKMGWAKRLLARVFVGGDVIGNAKWELATYHLRQSVVLEPQNKMFRLAYVQALEKQGWRGLSLDEARAGLAQEIMGPLDNRFHYLLRRFVQKIEDSLP